MEGKDNEVVNYHDTEIDLNNEDLIHEQTLKIIKDLRPNWDLNKIEFKVSLFCINIGDYYLFILII